MTYYPDLSAYEYTELEDDGEPHLNVGWLAAPHPFATKAPDDELIERLNLLRTNPVNQFRGSHPCDYCVAEIREQGDLSGPALFTALREADALGNGEIVIKGGRGWYHAPVMITHYVERHDYSPPAEFVDAVMAARA